VTSAMKFAMNQQKQKQAAITGKKFQNNEQIITAPIALLTTKAKSNIRALIVALFLLEELVQLKLCCCSGEDIF